MHLGFCQQGKRITHMVFVNLYTLYNTHLPAAQMEYPASIRTLRGMKSICFWLSQQSWRVFSSRRLGSFYLVRDGVAAYCTVLYNLQLLCPRTLACNRVQYSGIGAERRTARLGSQPIDRSKSN